ncbi:MAG: hypothetical protein HGA19_22285 [Oscillochloris sp.]|nr:hypothetical protein [Oscillochloris sp.]
MSPQPDMPSPSQRSLPVWLLPVVIFGAIIVVVALVTVALTMRELPATTISITADALPAGHPALEATSSADALPTTHPTVDPAATIDATALPSAHGGLDPNGPKVEMINLADARARLDAGTAVFIDVRPGTDYTAGHILGALTITSQELESRISALPEGSAIIAYGDATRPESAQRGAQIFMDLGYPTVIALEGGFQDWEQAGNPVER